MQQREEERLFIAFNNNWISQECAELTEAITDLFHHVRLIRSALDRIVHDFNHQLDSVVTLCFTCVLLRFTMELGQ